MSFLRAGSAHPRADLAILFISAIWGFTFVFVKRGLEDISPLLFITLRFGLGTLLLAGVYRGRLFPAPGARGPALKSAFLVGSILFAGYALQTAGLHRTSVAKAGFLTGLYIPLVPLFGALVYRTRPRLVEIAGIAIATLGTFLMTMPDAQALDGLKLLASLNPGDLLVIAATAAWALQIIVLGHFSKNQDGPVLAVGQIATTAMLGAATFWWVESPRAVWSTEAIVGVVFSAALATALAFAFQSWAQRFVPPNRAALLFATEPLFAWAAAYAVSRESLGGRAILGALLILASVLLVELKPVGGRGHPSGQVVPDGKNGFTG